MLNFAERTGSGAVMLVWSFLLVTIIVRYTTYTNITSYYTFITHYNYNSTAKAVTNAELESTMPLIYAASAGYSFETLPVLVFILPLRQSEVCFDRLIY